MALDVQEISLMSEMQRNWVGGMQRKAFTLEPKVAERAAADPKTMSTAVMRGFSNFEACWLENS